MFLPPINRRPFPPPPPTTKLAPSNAAGIPSHRNPNTITMNLAPCHTAITSKREGNSQFSILNFLCSIILSSIKQLLPPLLLTSLFFYSLCSVNSWIIITFFVTREEVDSCRNCERVELTEDVLVISVTGSLIDILTLKIALPSFIFRSHFAFFCASTARETLVLL